MKKQIMRIISVITALFLLVSASSLNLSAASKSQLQTDISKLERQNEKLQSEINALKTQMNKQQELKTAIESKIAVVQQQIYLCNSQINKINGTIAANKVQINKKNAQMEADKLAFKKRIRAIYMSQSGGDIQVLMGAENFSQFLQLSQLTASVSARDKILIQNIVNAVAELEKKQVENEELLKEQVAIKATIDAKQQELQSQNNEIQSVISSLSQTQGSKEKEQKENTNDIKAKQAELNKILNSGSGTSTKVVYDGGQFLWPAPGINKITSYFAWRWGRMHNGIDISNGAWGGKIVAIADGVVTRCVTGCPHDYRKNSSCGCGGGYGNYVVIDHGKGTNGNTYMAYYAHMQSVAVSSGQKVKKGQVIGYIGCTGYSTGPHLHFGMIVNGSWVNPLSYYTKVQ